MLTKIHSREETRSVRENWAEQGLKVGYTSGVFDLLHVGHVQYLREARSQCDKLIVGVNSDSSVKSYKESTRPVVGEAERMEVVSSLSSVDACFLFSERNNNGNIEDLKPDVYFKAGDYTEDQLSSAPLVRAYGGEVVIIPFRSGYSTTDLITKIESHTGVYGTSPEGHSGGVSRPAVFLDRDGTLIKHVEYLHDPEKVELLPGVIEGLTLLQEAGYLLIVVTNQPGIGFGYFPKEDLFRVNKRMLRELSNAGVRIDAIYYSPSTKAENSRCRKPHTGMIDRAVRDKRILLSGSVVIGDSTGDIKLAENIHCPGVLLKGADKEGDGLYEVTPSFITEDFLSAAKWIRSEMGPAKVEPSSRENDSHTDLLETIGRVTGKYGHDFNNLVGSMLGAVDLIEHKLKKVVGEENPVERQMSLLRRSLKKTITLISDIRGFPRPDEIELQEVPLSELFSEVMTKLEVPKEEFILELDSNLSVKANPFFLGAVLTSLIQNAREALAGHEERTVLIQEVSVGEDGGEVEVAIIDHGEGIPAELHSRIFEPFYSTRADGIGTGIGFGLPMARVLLQKMGGTLSFHSLPGRGTRVSIKLPGFMSNS